MYKRTDERGIYEQKYFKLDNVNFFIVSICDRNIVKTISGDVDGDYPRSIRFCVFYKCDDSYRKTYAKKGLRDVS